MSAMQSKYPRVEVHAGGKIVRVTWNTMTEAIFERDGDSISLISIEKRTSTASQETFEPTLRNVPEPVVSILEEIEGFEVSEG